VARHAAGKAVNVGCQNGCSASVPEHELPTGTPDPITGKRLNTVCSVFRFILPIALLTVIGVTVAATALEHRRFHSHPVLLKWNSIEAKGQRLRACLRFQFGPAGIEIVHCFLRLLEFYLGVDETGSITSDCGVFECRTLFPQHLLSLRDTLFNG